MGVSVLRARSDLVLQVRDPVPGPWFAEEAVAAVGTAVGYDGWCLFAVDPLSGLRSVMLSRDALQCPQERILLNETVDEDYHRFVDLVTGPRPVGVLAAGGPGAPKSVRLHEILVPEGFTSELRLVLVSGDRYWGALTLYRDERRHPFTEEEAAAAVALAEPLCQVVRRYNVGSPAPGSWSGPAGVVLLDRQTHVLDMSPEAHAWLAALAASWPDGVTEGDVIRMVYEVARAAVDGRADQSVCRVRMPGGGWLVASGTRVDAGDVGAVVVLRGGDVRSVVPAFAAWCGLTARETEVLAELVDGPTTRALARSLSIKPMTVETHLATIYRKAGVRGRDELLALLR